MTSSNDEADQDGAVPVPGEQDNHDAGGFLLEQMRLGVMEEEAYRYYRAVGWLHAYKAIERWLNNNPNAKGDRLRASLSSVIPKCREEAESLRPEWVSRTME